jgi:hypothetical protein
LCSTSPLQSGVSIAVPAQLQIVWEDVCYAWEDVNLQIALLISQIV